jgi:Putative stress-responsive transcriptional regulator
MKKTLTVNLGGTVFNIDDDAYRLLDNYLCNLKTHFRKETGADEIVDDMERRISELFSEKLSGGAQVITIADVEEVIKRMGKPEELDTESEESASEAFDKSATSGTNSGAGNEDTTSKDNKTGMGSGAYSHRRLYRNPDDKMLGGVCSGLAAYLDWDVTLLRILFLVILICGWGTLIPIYIVCWLVVPEARTAAEKLNMRGEAVTLENIGKTVTDGFEKAANSVNDFMKSDKPRTFLQKVGDAFVMIAGFILKVCLVIFAIVCSPILFVLGIVFIALLFAAVAVAVGGGAALISLFPLHDVIMPVSPLSSIVMYIAGILLVGIPLVSIVFVIFRQLFTWQPMSSGLRWTLLILWIVSVATFSICFAMQGFTFPELLIRG